MQCIIDCKCGGQHHRLIIHPHQHQSRIYHNEMCWFLSFCKIHHDSPASDANYELLWMHILC